jgi:biotin transporter BioY
LSAETRFWIQLAAAAFFVVITVAEMTGLKAPTFGFQMGWIILALAAATMGFEAWRTRRKMNKETTDG